MKKNIVSAAIGFGMVLAAVVPALAIDCTNNVTGALSTNICKIYAERYAKVFTRNNGSVNNTVNTTSNTGANQSNENTDGGFGILTGNAVANANPVQTQLNTNSVTINQSAPCDNCTASTGANSVTGYDSVNVAKIDVSKTARVILLNEGWVKNVINTLANSGGNQNNMNTITGGILTGDATATSAVNTILNYNTVNIAQ